MQAIHATARKRGDLPPTILPHPDDIVIDPEHGPRIIGPIDESEQAKLDETIRYRDVLIMQDALDHRITHRPDGTPVTDPGSAELFAMLLERAIPPRLRLSNTEWILHSMIYEDMPIPKLLKLLFNEWQKLRSSRP